MAGYDTILVPHDFSDHATAALEVAGELAERLGARLHLLHVIRPFTVAYPTWSGGADAVAPETLARLEEGAARSLREVAERTLGAGADAEAQVVVGASIAGTVRDHAEKVGADLIVMGTHGRTGIAHVFLGSNAERTLRVAPCPVLTVKAPEA